MKVVFVYPYYTEKIGNLDRVEMPPLGMLSVCAVLESLGCEVEVCRLESNTNLDLFPMADVYAYAITASVTYPMFLEATPKLKSKAGIHIAGNTHASIFPEKTLEELKLDAIFCGEGEDAIKSWYLSGCQGRGIINGERVDINNIIFPARHLLPDRLIYLDHRVGGEYDNIISLISSRGCTFRCGFCAVQNRGKVSFSRVERFGEEVQKILTDYPLCQGFVLMDETFTINESHSIAISEIIGKTGLPWECNSRIDTLNKEIIQSLVQNKCEEVKIGIETGSQIMADNMNKNIDIKKGIDTIKTASSLGLKIKLYIMHGFPGENMKTTQETIRLLSYLRPYVDRVAIYRFSPLPGSPIFSSPKLRIGDWDNYTIYQNDIRWWGDQGDFEELERSYKKLIEVVQKNYGKIN